MAEQSPPLNARRQEGESVEDERRKRSALRSRIIGEVYAKWAQEQIGTFSYDPEFEEDPNYSEHPALMSASPEADLELHRRTLEAIAEAGLDHESELDARRLETLQKESNGE